MTKTRLEVSDAESKEKGNKQIRVIWKFQSLYEILMLNWLENTKEVHYQDQEYKQRSEYVKLIERDWGPNKPGSYWASLNEILPHKSEKLNF